MHAILAHVHVNNKHIDAFIATARLNHEACVTDSMPKIE